MIAGVSLSERGYGGGAAANNSPPPAVPDFEGIAVGAEYSEDVDPGVIVPLDDDEFGKY